MTPHALDALKRIHAAFPKPLALAWNAHGMAELRAEGMVTLWDMDQQGNPTWIASSDANTAIKNGLFERTS